MKLPLYPDNVDAVYRWLEELFELGTPNAWGKKTGKKNLTTRKGNFILEATITGKKDGPRYGSIDYELNSVSDNPKAIARSLSLHFGIIDSLFQYITLVYTYSGKRYLGIRWDTGEPPDRFADFLREGEVLTRERAVTPADPSLDRDIKVELFPHLNKSPFIPLITPYYEETVARLFAEVEHEDVHTDTGGFYEGEDFRLRIATDLSLLGE